MEPRGEGDAKRVIAAAADADPRTGLRAVASLRVLTEALALQQVEAALRSGLGWQDVGDALGVSRQAVHRKYHRRIDPTIDVRRRGRTRE